MSKALARKQQMDQLTGLISMGVSPNVAAEAAGVQAEVFECWMTTAKGKEFTAFRKAVREAQAQAVARAEMEVYKDSPEKWLRYGPGKRAGWKGDGRIVEQHNKQTNVIVQQQAEDVGQLQQVILAALADLPEARAKVAQALANLARPAIEAPRGQVTRANPQS
jgi:hypothetical protein